MRETMRHRRLSFTKPALLAPLVLSVFLGLPVAGAQTPSPASKSESSSAPATAAAQSTAIAPSGVVATPIPGPKPEPAPSPPAPKITITAIKATQPVRTGSQIELDVTGLQALVDYSVQNKREFAIYLNHALFQGVNFLEVDAAHGKVSFRLDRSPKSLDFWTEIYRDTRLYSDQPVAVPMGLGLDHGEELATYSDLVPIAPVNFPMLLVWTTGCIVYLVAAFWAAKKTHLIRDRPIPNITDPSYSLGRTQLAAWFVLVTSCATFIWVVTGSLPSLGNTAPVLFVSGTTAAVAAGVDTYKNTVVHQSQGFWKDLLTDGDGLALHRVQIVIANAIVGLAFLLGTFETLTIEAFDNTWVALLGASSVAFCGLKGAAPDAATAAAARAAQR